MLVKELRSEGDALVSVEMLHNARGLRDVFYLGKTMAEVAHYGHIAHAHPNVAMEDFARGLNVQFAQVYFFMRCYGGGDFLEYAVAVNAFDVHVRQEFAGRSSPARSHYTIAVTGLEHQSTRAIEGMHNHASVVVDKSEDKLYNSPNT